MNLKASAAASSTANGPFPLDIVASSGKPDRLLTVAMALAGPVITVVLACIIWSLAQSWRWPPGEVSIARIQAERDIGMALCLCLVITVLRLASGAFKSGSVKAGPAEVDFSTQ